MADRPARLVTGPPPRFVIVDATYGLVNVTSTIKKMARGDNLYLPAKTNLNNLLGDPTPGRTKRFIIHFSYLGCIMSHTTHEFDGRLIRSIVLGRGAEWMDLPDRATRFYAYFNTIPHCADAIYRGKGDIEQLKLVLPFLNDSHFTTNTDCKVGYYTTNDTDVLPLAIHLVARDKADKLIAKLSSSRRVLDVDFLANKRAIVLSELLPPPAVLPAIPTDKVEVYYVYQGNVDNLRFFEQEGMAGTRDVEYHLRLAAPLTDILPLSPKWRTIRKDLGICRERIWATIHPTSNIVIGVDGEMRGPYAKDWVTRYLECFTVKVGLVGLTMVVAHGIDVERRGKLTLPYVHLDVWAIKSECWSLIQPLLLADTGRTEQDVSSTLLSKDHDISCTLVDHQTGYLNCHNEPFLHASNIVWCPGGYRGVTPNQQSGHFIFLRPGFY